MKTIDYSPYTVVRRYIVLFLLLGLSMAAYAQKLDSLKALLLEYKLADTSRVEVLIDMTRVYRDSSPDSMLAVSKKALELARRTNYRKGEAEALFQAGVAYATLNKYDSGLAYYKSALSVIQANGFQKLECQLLLDIVMVYSRLNKIDDGLATAQRCVMLSRKWGFWEQEATAHLRAGDLYRDKTQYTEALNKYLSALKVYEAHRWVKGQGEAHRDMADIYSLIGNYPKALESIEKSNAMYTAGDDLQEVIVNYTSTGAVYGQMKDYDRSLAAYRKAAALADSIKNPFWRGLAFLNMGECFNGMEQADSAECCYRIALAEIQKSGDAMAAAYCNRGMGQVALKKGRTTEAIRYLLQAYDVMRQAKVARELFEISRLLSQAYEQNKDYASALKYMHIHLEYRDTIFNEDNLKRIQDLQRDYELNRKEAEIKLLSKDKQIEQGNVARQRAVMWGLVSGLVLLVVIIVLLFISRRAEKRNKQKIIEQRDELAAQAVRLDELNSFKDKTFSVLSHDLRGPIASVSSAIGLLDNDLAKEELEMIKPEINRQLGAVSMLLENLLNWSRGHMQGGKGVNRQPTDLKQLVADNIAMAAPVAAGKQIKIENRIDTEVFALADKGQIDIVIRNLLNNAVKFTDKGGLVHVNARKTGSDVSLSVTDTGVGMTSEQIAKLFKPAGDKSTYGTSGEKGTGLGLLLCSEFITANEGRIDVTSEKGNGCTFTITLPGL